MRRLLLICFLTGMTLAGSVTVSAAARGAAGAASASQSLQPATVKSASRPPQADIAGNASHLPQTATALDAFFALLADSSAESVESAEEVQGSDAILDAIMAGAYSEAYGETAQTQTTEADLAALCAITNKDIAAYAAANGFTPAQVRNAYFKALAHVLRAEFAVAPAESEKHENARTILALFLNLTDESTDSEMTELREQMTPQHSAQIAEDYGLPEAFVEFVIMDADWNDHSWENDSDWMSGTAWDAAEADSVPDITIGMRDDTNSSRIADLQEKLIRLGYLKGKADGVFGARTQAALLEFQLANAMKADGIYSGYVDRKLAESDVVARWDYGASFWNPGGDTDDTPDSDTPDYDTPDVDTPDLHTPDYETPEVDTPDVDTPDYDTADYDTPDYDT